VTHTRSLSSTTLATLRGITGSIIGHCSVVALLETSELAPWNFGHDKPGSALLVSLVGTLSAGLGALDMLLDTCLLELLLDRLPRWIDIDLRQLVLRHRHLRCAFAMRVELEHECVRGRFHGGCDLLGGNHSCVAPFQMRALRP